MQCHPLAQLGGATTLTRREEDVEVGTIVVHAFGEVKVAGMEHC